MLDFEQKYQELTDYTRKRNLQYKEDSLQALKKKRADLHPKNFSFFFLLFLVISFGYAQNYKSISLFSNIKVYGQYIETFSVFLAVVVFFFAAFKLVKILIYFIFPDLYDSETAILHDKALAIWSQSLISWEEYFKNRNNFLKIFYETPIFDCYSKVYVFNYTLKDCNILKISFDFEKENNGDILLIPTGQFFADFLDINVLQNAEIEKFDYFEYIEKYFEIRTDKRGSASKFLEANQLDIEQIDNIAKQINLPIALSFSKTQSNLYVLIDLNRVFAPLLKQVNLDTLKQAVEHPRGLRNQLIAIRQMSELILKISKNEMASDT